MSIHRLSSLDAYCDECSRAFGETDDEPANAPGVGIWTTDLREARQDMKTYGWKFTRRGNKMVDLCPKCAGLADAEEAGKGNPT